jgi:hypothetical protein
MFDFDSFIEALDDNPFEEKPVDLKTFLYDDQFLGLKRLSPAQELLVDMISQVYRRKDLERLYPDDVAKSMWDHTKNEIVMMLGKGSGKDFTSTVGCAYLVYKLLCLKNPAEYFDKPAHDTIDILNIAINAKQANNVFFKNFVTRIEQCPWFMGKFDAKTGFVAFDKNITVHSGHSERESWEGYNVILVVLDEIAGFSTENASGSETAKTADAIYDMYRASVDSRFADVGKVVMLSFPRYKDDFISRHYEKVVAEKDTVIKSHVYKLNEDLPDGLEENEMYIEWEEDHIQSYTISNTFALRRPSWDINPTKTVDDYKRAFFNNPTDALMRFACMPPDAIDAFFKSREKIERAFCNTDEAILSDGQFNPDFKPEKDKIYYIHVDLAQKHDYCAVAMAHVDSWVKLEQDNKYRSIQPKIVIDMIKYWKPRPDQPLDLKEVVQFILSVKDLGFPIRLITFDRWNSIQTRQELEAYGLKTDLLSVALDHYTDLSVAVNEERIIGPALDILHKELLQLRIIRQNKIDHPRTGSKDLADAVTGAAYNAAKYTHRPDDDIIEVYTPDITREDRSLEEEADARWTMKQRKQMPANIAEFMEGLRVL